MRYTKGLLLAVLLLFVVDSVGAITFYSDDFGYSVVVDDAPAEESYNTSWHVANFSYSVVVNDNSTNYTTVWYSDTFGFSVVVEGYSYGNWSDWWLITYASSPLISGVYPENNSMGNPQNLSWNCTISNPDGNGFNWSIECSNGQTNSSTDDSNGSKSISLTDLNVSSMYTIWVNASSNLTSSACVSEVFYFNTTSGIDAGDPSPSNGELSVSRDLLNLSVNISDPEGDSFNWTIETYPDIGTASGNGDGNGSKNCSVSGNLSYQTFYTWYVNATDGNNTVNRTYTFTVEDLDPVSSFVASRYNSSVINLSWSKNSNVSYTYVRYKKGSAPSGLTDGELLTNTTNTSFNHTGLDYGTHYYYRAWSYNCSDIVFSDSYSSCDNYTNPGPPSDFQVTSTGMTSVLFQISKGVNATNTVLFVNGTSPAYPNTSNGVEQDNDTGTVLTASGLTGNTTYNFSVYSFNPDSGLWSEGNDTVSVTTTADSDAPSSAVAVTSNDTAISLSWTKGSDYTVIYRKAGGYPTTSDTEIYNGTGTIFTDDGLTPAVHYYYRLYGWNGEFLSAGSSVCDNITLPSPPVNLSGDISGTILTIAWTKGTGAARTVILNNTADYPDDETDGTVQYNDTGTLKTVTGVTDINYFTGFSYVVVDGTPLYSLGENMVWGGIEINAYKETDPSVELSNYTVFITNQAGTETYHNTSASNPFRISVDEVPNGDDCIIQVSKDGYYTRTKVYDLYENNFYIIPFYLAPKSSGGGDEGDADYIPPANEEDVLKSTSRSVSNPAVNLSVTLECEPSLIVLVRGYNESLYGHWFNIPNDKYSVASNIVEVDSSVIDANTSLIEVQYYCDNTENYAQQYLVTILDVADNPVDSALINVKVYVNTTDTWETIYIVYSDGSGEADFYLIPGTLYKFTISKEGYQTEIADWYPSESKYTKEFTLFYDDTDEDEFKHFSEFISYNATMNSNGSILVCYSDVTMETIDCQFYIYNNFNGTITFVDSVSYIGNNDFCFYIMDINTSRVYYVELYFNHTYDFDVTEPVVRFVGPINFTNGTTHTTTQATIDEYFTYALGENSLGWGNTFAVIVAILILASFGPFHAGLGIIGAASGLFSVELVFSFNNLALILIIPVVIALGIFYILATKPEAHA